MSDNSIHDFDVNIICEYFSTIDRQGPGSENATWRAASFLHKLPYGATIADLGCGTGGQTLTLTECFPDARIKALDLFPKFIDILRGRCKACSNVEGMVGSMDDLPFEKESLDAIWCEGAVYNIGFRRALDYWRDYLKDGGYIAMTDASWLTAERPAEIEAFWKDAYPGIQSVSESVSDIVDAGYMPEAVFVLGDECWTDNFYEPQREAQRKFLARYPDNPTAGMLVCNQRREAEMYSRYSRYYGYVFYICRKQDAHPGA